MQATSALDSHSEVAVQEALNGLMASGEHTTVVIAHRLSTIKNADNIVVMDAGRVVEQGTHDELMAIEGGIYRDLVEAQSSGRDGTLAELCVPRCWLVLVACPHTHTIRTLCLQCDLGNQGQRCRPSRCKCVSRQVSISRPPHDVRIQRAGAASRVVCTMCGPPSLTMGRGVVWCGDRQSVVKEADPDIDTSVKRIFKMSLPEWPWIIVAMLSAMVYGSQNPLFAVAFSEMVALFFEPKIQDMRDDSLFWALGFGVLAVAASTLLLVLLLAACLSWCGGSCSRSGCGVLFVSARHQACLRCSCSALSAFLARAWGDACGRWH